MPIQRHNRMVTMTPEQWEMWERIALRLVARNRTGVHANQISVNAVFKGIGDGIYVVEHQPRLRQDLKRLDEAIAENERKTSGPEYRQLNILEPEPA